MKQSKMMTPGDIERLAARNRTASKLLGSRVLTDSKADNRALRMLPPQERNMALHKAIAKGDVSLVGRLLQAKANPNSQVDGQSALEQADRHFRRADATERPAYGSIVDMLIEAGAKDTRKSPAEQLANELLQAIDSEDAYSFREILEKADEENVVVDHQALLERAKHKICVDGGSSGLYNILDLLRNRRADMQRQEQTRDIRNIPDQLVRDLLEAIDWRSVSRVEDILLNTRVELDTVVDGWTALGRARHNFKVLGFSNRLEIIIEQLELHGAKLDLRGSAREEAETTPPVKSVDRRLHTAVSQLNCNAAACVLAQNADVHSVVEGLTLKERIAEQRERVGKWDGLSGRPAHQKDESDLADMMDLLRRKGVEL
jgi:hypothetical protein